MTNTKKISAKLIEVLTWKQSQSVHFRKIIELDTYKIKLEIKQDSHKPQSYATAFVYSFANSEWRAAYSIPYPLMKTKEDLMYGSENITSNLFTQDAETLMAGVTSILF
jgi:HKD family nuclease